MAGSGGIPNVLTGIPYTSYDKFQSMERAVEVLMKPPSEGLLIHAPVCSFISKLDKQHESNCRKLQSGLHTAQKIWNRTFEKHDVSGKKPPAESPLDSTQLMDRFASGFSSFMAGSVGLQPPDGVTMPVYREPVAKTLAYRAGIVKLTDVLQTELSWMQKQCELATVFRVQKLQYPENENERKQVQNLIDHFSRTIDNVNRLMQVTVQDPGMD